jgi:hypothetical protein
MPACCSRCTYHHLLSPPLPSPPLPYCRGCGCGCLTDPKCLPCLLCLLVSRVSGRFKRTANDEMANGNAACPCNATALATKLGAGLSVIPGLEVEPVLANEVFTRASPAFVESLRAKGHDFLDFSVLGTDKRRFRLGTYSTVQHSTVRTRHPPPHRLPIHLTCLLVVHYVQYAMRCLRCLSACAACSELRRTQPSRLISLFGS